jgi:hypothetical protein
MDQQIFTMSRGQKRMTFDSSLLATQSIQLEPRPSPPKRARTSSADILAQRNVINSQQQSQASSQQHQLQQQQHQQQQHIQHLHQQRRQSSQQNPQHPQQTQAQQSQPQQSQQTQSHQQQIHPHPHQPSQMTAFPINIPPQPNHSPEYTTQHSGMNPHGLIASPTQITSASLQAVTGHPPPNQPSQSLPPQHSQHHHTMPQSYHHLSQPPSTHILQSQGVLAHSNKQNLDLSYGAPVHPTPTVSSSSHATPQPPISRRVSPVASIAESATDKAQIHFAGLNEAQRRTQAILQLQNRETEMPDEDMVEVLAEFESNVAAADTYLAIQKDGLRRMYLGKVIKRRKGG